MFQKCRARESRRQNGHGATRKTTERLVKYDLCALQQPLDSERPLRIEIRRDNEWYTATLIAQSATGAVTLRLSDGTETQVHLQSEGYRWLT